MYILYWHNTYLTYKGDNTETEEKLFEENSRCDTGSQLHVIRTYVAISTTTYYNIFQ